MKYFLLILSVFSCSSNEILKNQEGCNEYYFSKENSVFIERSIINRAPVHFRTKNLLSLEIKIPDKISKNVKKLSLKNGDIKHTSKLFSMESSELINIISESDNEICINSRSVSGEDNMFCYIGIDKYNFIISVMYDENIDKSTIDLIRKYVSGSFCRI
ncbi:MAG: hypothetical protein HRU38_20055 [Saccharospirillaceae bacterium]|nr:hypothetical protein [Pseudomonadales bacterium]NRB80927.1 hypothetical protein [Saccharospirillaceae bacterium]